MKTSHAIRNLGAASLTLAALLLPHASNAQHLYAFTDLGAAYGPNSAAVAISSNGLVSGVTGFNYNVDAHGFTTFGGPMHDIGTLGGKLSIGYGINAFGQVVGFSSLSNGETHAIAYRNGLVDIGGLPGGHYSSAQCVNDNAIAGGQSGTKSGAYHAVLWNLIKGAVTDLDPKGTSSGVTGLNASNEAAGYWMDAKGYEHAVKWSGGVMTDLGNLGFPFAQANAINNAGQIVGLAQIQFNGGFVGTTGFLWDSATGMKAIPSLFGGNDTALYAINNSGDAVGYGRNFALETRAALYHNNTLFDLNDYVDPNLGWTLNFANAINDKGEIVGQATSGAVEHAYKLTPVGITALTLVPSTVKAGSIAVGTITLNAPTPKSILVAISSNNPAVKVPSLILVPKGAQKHTIFLQTKIVAAPTAGAITVAYDNTKATQQLLVKP